MMIKLLEVHAIVLTKVHSQTVNTLFNHSND